MRDAAMQVMVSCWLPLGAVLAIAVYHDVRFRKIPNWLTASILVYGLIWSWLAPSGAGAFDPGRPGSVGFLNTIGSTAAVLVCFFSVYLLRLLGAGDAKLIAGVATFFGGWQVLGLVLAIGMAGGVLVAVRLIDRRRRTVLAANLKTMCLTAVGGGGGPGFDPAIDTADRLPFAVAIAGGTAAFAVYVFLDLGVR